MSYLLTHSLSDNLKARDASASKKESIQHKYVFITAFSFDFIVVYSFSSLRIFFWLIWLNTVTMMMMKLLMISTIIPIMILSMWCW